MLCVVFLYCVVLEVICGFVGVYVWTRVGFEF